MKFKQLIPLAFLAIVSCKVNDPYQRPDLSQPETFYGQDSTAQEDSVNIGDISWKEFFNDSTLISLIETALINNVDMQKAMKNIEISSLFLKQSKSDFYPSLDLFPAGYRREYFSENYNNYGSNRSRRNHGSNPPGSFYTERVEYTTTLFASWELDIWGKLKLQKEISKAAFMQTQEFQKAVQTSLIAEIASTYYSLLMLKSQIEVSKRNLALNENTLTIVKLQYNAGEVTSLAIHQTESQKLKAQTLIPQLEREYTIQENRLNQLIGRYPQPIEIDQDLEKAELESNYDMGVPLELIKNRPDVAASEYDLIASNARVGIAQAMKYPSLTINASVGLNSFELDKFLNPVGSGFAMLNGAIFHPVFQRGRLKTNHKVALAEKELAELEFKNKLMIAISEVANALVTVEKLKEEYSIAQERITANRQGVTDASLLFRSGLANYLEVITAQSDALESELNLANVQLQIFLAKIELYRSLGGGWK